MFMNQFYYKNETLGNQTRVRHPLPCGPPCAWSRALGRTAPLSGAARGRETDRWAERHCVWGDTGSHEESRLRLCDWAAIGTTLVFFHGPNRGPQTEQPTPQRGAHRRCGSER